MVRVEAGEYRVEIRFRLPDLDLVDVGQGEQHLYELVLECDGAEERVRFGVSPWSS